MRADAYLTAARALPLTDLATITAGRALILAPHADDESLGCAGLIAEACAQGLPPLVAVLTDGTGSHPHSRTFPPDRLRQTREAETLAATTTLGLAPEHVTFLRTRDTQAPQTGAAFQDVVERIARLIRTHACRSIFATWGADPHCDHVAAHDAARAAAATTGILHRAYPVWGLTLPPDTELGPPPAGWRLDVTRHLPAKRRAIACHRSQYGGLIDDDPTGFQLDPAFLALFDQSTETFFEVLS